MTGVQTCALPISAVVLARGSNRDHLSMIVRAGDRRSVDTLEPLGLEPADTDRRGDGIGDVGSAHVNRSEERRGGKECVRTCRSGWSPYHDKNKRFKTPHTCHHMMHHHPNL